MQYELEEVTAEKKARNSVSPVTSGDNHSASDGGNGDAAAGNDKFGLQRTMGLTGSIAINLGTMIGDTPTVVLVDLVAHSVDYSYKRCGRRQVNSMTDDTLLYYCHVQVLAFL